MPGLLIWKRGERGQSVFLFRLPEVKCTLTPLTWVSASCSQAVHTGMRALIYNSSTGGSQAEQSGMRTYYFSADTQEDMNAWVRAMNQAAQVLSRSSLKRSVPMEGPCQSTSHIRLGTQIRTLGCPKFHLAFTHIKHCPFFEVLFLEVLFLRSYSPRGENAYTVRSLRS